MSDAEFESTLRESFERNPDGALLLDREWIVRRANRAFGTLVGRAPLELLERPVADVLPGAAADVLLDALRRVGADGEPVVLPLLQFGPEVWVAPRVMPGGGGGFTIVLRDTSELKRVELALGERERQYKRVELAHRFLLEASTVLSGSLDYEVTLASIARLSVPHIADWCSVHLLDGGELRQVAVAHVDPSRVAYARELALRYPTDLADRTGVAQVIRSGQSELIPEIDDTMLVASARDAEHLRIARGLGLRSYMCVPLHSRERGVLGAITLVASDSGRRFGSADLAVAEELARRCAQAIDGALLLRHAQAAEQQSRQLSEELERRVGERTGELVRARDRLTEANTRLREQGSIMDELIGALSFQLRGPLESIAGDADNLLEGTGLHLREEHRQVVRRVAASSRLMLSLVHDLLDRSRMASGRFELEREPVDACALVRDVLAALAPLLATQGLRVVTRYPDTPARAHADPQRLEQVMIAIVHNAVQISSPGALLRVAVDVGDRDIRVEVQHTGERLADAAVARVFQRFTQHEGAWLGLPTAQRIVQAHDGRIGVEPGNTGGNVFWFTLPRLAE